MDSLAPPAPLAPEAPSPIPLSRHRKLLFDWFGIFSAYFSAQGLTQLAGALAGILLVRSMPVGEFALYTLATSAISFFTFASDLGSTSSLLYFYQRTIKEQTDFGPYFAAVLSLRRIGFLLGSVAVLLVFPRTALAKGFRPLDVGLITAAILVGVWFQIASSVRVLSLRLAGRYGQAYRAELAGSVVRLVFALLMVATALLRAWIGILATSLGILTSARLAAPPDRAPLHAELGSHRRQVLRYILPSLPSALYFSVQGPLVIWLAATFGATRNIAEVGALGRLGFLVGLFSGLTGIVFLPRMARIVDERLYRRRYLQYGSLLVAIAIGLFIFAWLTPELFLVLLGKSYHGLHRELLVVVAGSGVTLLSGYAVGVNFARSWNRWEGLAMLVLIAAQAIFVALLPLSTTAGVLLFSLLSGVVGLSLQLTITALGFWRPRWVQWMP
jgi:O-antigen/teichoic acid export membrane protein